MPVPPAGGLVDLNSSDHPIRIATRGSPLALAQANLLLAQCQAACPDQAFAVKIIKTSGDKFQSASLASAELPKGLFTKEIEEALWQNEADLGVHSLKDLPTELPAGLRLGAVGPRADARDVLIHRDLDFLISHVDTARPVEQRKRGYKPRLTIRALPHGATVATSSTRRREQVLEQRPDLKILPIRGNVGTRLRKVAEQAELDAIILAAAGLERLGFRLSPGGQLVGEGVPDGLAATYLSISEMLPCVGQAAIGIEVREKDPLVESLCAKLDHLETRQCVTAERAFLQAMGGGCHLAVAAFAEVIGQELRLRAVSFLSGSPRRGEARASCAEAESLGRDLAAQLLSH